MSIYDKMKEIARDQANQTFRVLSSNLVAQNQPPPVLALVLTANGDNTYAALLPDGTTVTVTAGGSNPISPGNVYHIIGSVIY